MTITLRKMTDADLDDGFALTQKLKWPHQRADWQQSLQLGEGVAVIDEGKMLGSAICWRWGDDYATVGLVIIADELQGRGIGCQLMVAMLEKLSGYHVRLHATEMGRGLYEKLGFVAMGHIRQQQSRQLGSIAPLAVQAGWQLRDGHAVDAAVLTTLDQRASGMLRPQLIDLLLSQAQLRVLTDAQQQVQGFATVRRFGHGYVVGPVIASDEASAKVLVADALSRLAGEFVRIDTNGPASFCGWLNDVGLSEVDAPVMMVRGTPWQSQDVQAFALMSQAMG